jgi:hypothetical protein
MNPYARPRPEMDAIVQELLEHRMTFIARGMQPPSAIVLPPAEYQRVWAYWTEKFGTPSSLPFRVMGFVIKSEESYGVQESLHESTE